MKHILFLFFDQLRFDAIRALGGNRYLQTPSFDALAAESVVFDRCITPSPVCVPARLSLMAGQYPNRTGNSNNNPELQYKGEGLYATFSKNDYNTFCVGKMHFIWDKGRLGPIGFKKRLSMEARNKDDYSAFLRTTAYNSVVDCHGQLGEMYYVPQISPLPAEVHPTQWVGDHSVNFLDEIDPQKENIFLFSSIFHPHPPFSPPAPWHKLYRDIDPKAPHVPENFDREDFKPLLYPNFARDYLQVSDLDLYRLRNFYYACVSFADYQVGRIIAKLKEKGMYDDTIIVMASDHGEMLGDYGSLGKRTMFDAAARVPLMIRIPGHAHEVRHDPCSLVDIAPTLLSYAGIDYDPAEFDGVDLFSDARHEEVYSQYDCGPKGVYMVATERDKLIYTASADRYYFFEDMDEDVNRYDETNPKVRALKEKLDAYRAADRGKPIPPKGNGSAPASKPFNIPKDADDKTLYDLETSRIPAGYVIDIKAPVEGETYGNQ